jgi:hypothetical protein
MELLQSASNQSLDDPDFRKFLAIDWRSVCLAKDGELDSINQLSQALVTQISSKSTRIHSVITDVVAPFFLGSSDNTLPALSATEKFMFETLHSLIQTICELYPLSAGIVFRDVCGAFPFYATCSPHSFVSYVYNMLSISSLLASYEQETLSFVLDRVYLLDVNTNLSDPDDEQQHLKLEHSVEMIIRHINSGIITDGKLDEDKALHLYGIIYPAFIQTICPSSKSLQSMFCMFYLASTSDRVAGKLCGDLWSVFNSETVDPVRVLGVLTSFCTRSVAVNFEYVIELLTKLSNTCHEYLERAPVSSGKLVMEKHARFYAAFQSLVYLMIIRSSDIPDPQILHILQIPKLVNSWLRPLSFCPEAIADSFTRTASQLHIILSNSVSEIRQHPNSEMSCNPDSGITLHYHTEPLPMIRRRVAHLMRPIDDPDVCAMDIPVKSLSYEKRWTEAAELDFTF